MNYIQQNIALKARPASVPGVQSPGGPSPGRGIYPGPQGERGERKSMKKLNNIINTNNVTAYGFPAIKGLAERSNTGGDPAIVSTLSAAVMADMGIDTYYAPVMPRNAKYATTEDVIAANLDVNLVHVEHTQDVPTDAPVIIVSRHPGTVSILQDTYHNSIVLADITPDDITGKDVVGTLPPNLIQYARSFRAVAIKDFDYNKDGDLSGEELKERMIFTGTIRVTVDDKQ